MTTTLELPPDLVVDLENEDLIQDGRYVIYPSPNAAKPKRYTRASTWAAHIDDERLLKAWHGRMVAIGLGRRPDLLEYVQATPEDDDDKLNELCQKAVEAAKGDARANRGSAAHGFFARILAGEALDVPPTMRTDVQEALACLKRHDLTPLPDLIEAVLVCETIGVAGRTDLACTNADGELVIVDLKTGDDLLKYAALKTAIQLAIYANADTVYDPAAKTHRPMPAVRKDVAYALHRPLGTDRCDLISFDVAAGWKYASEVIPAVKEARNHAKRKTNSLYTVIAPPCGEITAAELLPTAQLRAWIVQRINTLKAGHKQAAHALAERWPGVPGFKGDHEHTDAELREVARVLDAVERDFSVPFGTLDPTAPPAVVVVPPDERVSLPPLVDEGGPCDGSEVAAVIAQVDALGSGVRAVLNGWAREANAVGRPFSIKLNRSQRRLAIYRALLELVPLVDGDDTDLVRATVALVVPDAAQLAVPLGHAVSALSTGEAERLAELAGHVAATHALVYEDDGTAVRWAETTNNQEQNNQ